MLCRAKILRNDTKLGKDFQLNNTLWGTAGIHYIIKFVIPHFCTQKPLQLHLRVYVKMIGINLCFRAVAEAMIVSGRFPSLLSPTHYKGGADKSRDGIKVGLVRALTA